MLQLPQGSLAKARPHVTFDFETCLIRPGYTLPLPVAAGFVWPNGQESIVHWSRCEDALAAVLDADVLIVGHHVAFDLAVAAAQYPRLQPRIFKAYDEDRVTCTMRRAQLIDTFDGKRQGYRNERGQWTKPQYSLAALSRRYLGLTLSKDAESWQKRYAELIHLRPEEWPEGARNYLMDDIRSTDTLFRMQEATPMALHDQYNKARTMFGVQLMTAWGLRTRYEGVLLLERRALERLAALETFLMGEGPVDPSDPSKIIGLVRDDAKRSRNTHAAKILMIQETCPELDAPRVLADIKLAKAADKAAKTTTNIKALVQTFPSQLRLTDTYEVSLDAEACTDSESEVLKAYAEITSTKTTISKDVKDLLGGVTYPVHSRFDIVATGRNSASGPNIQNPGGEGGVRECYVPRPGCVFLQSDYSTLELCTLAEYCMEVVGFSELGRILNAGEDPHSTIGANMIGVTYARFREMIKAGDKSAKNARKAAKPVNFGFPGGMGPKSFCAFAKGYGFTFTMDEAREYRDVWHRTYPEMRPYFAIVNSRKDPRDPTLYMVHQIRTNRIRGGAMYCAACNSPFQGLGADCTQRAHWALTKAMYTDRSSPLFGSRLVNFLHDEMIVECPDDDRLQERGQELQRIMVTSANELLHHVPVKASAAVAMRVWSKNAHRMEEGGRLVPWSQTNCGCDECNEYRKELQLCA